MSRESTANGPNTQQIGENPIKKGGTLSTSMRNGLTRPTRQTGIRAKSNSNPSSCHPLFHLRLVLFCRIFNKENGQKCRGVFDWIDRHSKHLHTHALQVGRKSVAGRQSNFVLCVCLAASKVGQVWQVNSRIENAGSKQSSPIDHVTMYLKGLEIGCVRIAASGSH